jgi:hypothetical protein
LFFSGLDELADCAHRLLADPGLNRKVRSAGHTRAISSGYDHLTRAAELLSTLEEVMG